ncbi:MAG: HD domain-containing protein [Acholeplasmatales bacterium]|nr:HD domain-containing protein [Acholeplasmatales bacterium]
MEIELNKGLIKSISILEENGYKAYIVGGFIRNKLLNFDIVDYDITTSASIDEIINLFKDYNPKLYSHNQCVNISNSGIHIEISTFKGKNIQEDLSKRDFTINSIAYSPKEGFIDPYNGIEDIKNKILKSNKSSYECFKDNPIRLLRAMRFECIYNLNIDENLYDGIIKYSNMINDIHPMKIQKEINPILISNKCSYFVNKYKEIFFELFPKLKDTYGFLQHSKWHKYDVFTHTLKVIEATKENLEIRLVALLHDVCKPECFYLGKDGKGHFPKHPVFGSKYAKEMLLKYSYNKIMVDRISKLILFHDERLECEKDIIKFIFKFGYEDLDLYFDIQRADILGQNPDLVDRVKEIDEMEKLTYQLIKEKKVLYHKELQISLADIKALGLINSEKIFVNILFLILDNKIANERDVLLNFIAKLKN